MNKKLILLNIVLIAGLLLAACSPSSVTIQLPGAENPDAAAEQANMNMTLIYVLVGALIVIALAALLGKRGSQ